jgi:hypothetical protein
VKIVRFTDPKGAYTDNLTRFVADVRAGGQPVLMTPIAKHVFVGDQVQETHGAYAQAVRDVAKATGAPLIDLDADMMGAQQARGEAGSRGFYLIYTPQDTSPAIPRGSATPPTSTRAGRGWPRRWWPAPGVPEAAGLGLCASGVDRRPADPRRPALPGAIGPEAPKFRFSRPRPFEHGQIRRDERRPKSKEKRSTAPLARMGGRTGESCVGREWTEVQIPTPIFHNVEHHPI